MWFIVCLFFILIKCRKILSKLKKKKHVILFSSISIAMCCIILNELKTQWKNSNWKLFLLFDFFGKKPVWVIVIPRTKCTKCFVLLDIENKRQIEYSSKKSIEGHYNSILKWIGYFSPEKRAKRVNWTLGMHLQYSLIFSKMTVFYCWIAWS